jgi:DNA-binding winged helix-turn-helix (wHTH) protein
MTSGSYRFDGFTLDPGERQLRRGDALVEINARYLDALLLLVRNPGRLVSKDRFLDEIWRGVPVTEEALTQCIRTLRRQLGDDVARPRYIETVPKHGYRFIATVEQVEEGDPIVSGESRPAQGSSAAPNLWRQCLLFAAAGTTGAGVAGIFGGLFYGFIGASQSLRDGAGLSLLLVLISINVVVGLTGGAGVSLGIALSGLLPGRRWRWSIAGGTLGGFVLGAVVKVLGLDAFNLLLGQSPGDITGALEGLLLGGAVGFGIWLGRHDTQMQWTRRNVIAAALAGGIAGSAIPLLGGRLMGGSLDLLAHNFPRSRLHLDQIGAVLGEQGFGPISQVATGCLEGALFGACVVGAVVVLSPLLTVDRVVVVRSQGFAPH